MQDIGFEKHILYQTGQVRIQPIEFMIFLKTIQTYHSTPLHINKKNAFGDTEGVNYLQSLMLSFGIL